MYVSSCLFLEIVSGPFHLSAFWFCLNAHQHLFQSKYGHRTRLDPSLKSVNSQPYFSWFRCMHNTIAALTKSSFCWKWAERFKVNNVDVQEILEKKKKVVASRDRFETCYFYWAHLTFSSVVPAGLDSLYQRTFSRRITAYRKGCWYIATGWNLNRSCCSERNFSQPYPIDHSFLCSF